MLTLLAALCFLAVVTQAKAEITVKDYRARMMSDDAARVMKTYIKGLGDGIGWANAQANSRKAPLFCQPRKLALDVENFVDIINRQIAAASTRLTEAKLDET
jgi:hypothetical protein